MDICADAETGKVLRPIEIHSIGTSGAPDRANPASIKLLKQLGDKQAQFVESEARTRRNTIDRIQAEKAWDW